VGIGEIVSVSIYEPLDDAVPAPRSPGPVPQRAKPVRLRPAAETDAALKKHLAANQIIDDETGEPWRPESLRRKEGR
jgi:hypothetical protein